MAEEKHPVQGDRPIIAAAPAITLRAYEVYRSAYGEQKAMVTGGCRGGFSTGELIALLYARTFPEHEWRDRLDEALEGLTWGPR